MDPVKLTETPVASFDLEALATTLESQEAFQNSTHTAASLVKGDDLRVVLTVMHQGAKLKEHSAPRSAIVIVLEGEILMSFSEHGEEKRLSKGNAAAFDAKVPHDVEALQDSRIAIIIGGHKEAKFRDA